ncbi:MAG: hypothetical protein HZB80_02715 [Deltaproteobacteria bacterium]|nr:hypothetical protein [Deltaproteobacteria bacterium]
MSEHDIIKTKIFRSSEDFILKRAQRITEAIAFEGGNIANPKKHLISTLPNGKESYFLKPGKETQRAVPNIHDMFPNVGSNNKSETDGYTFEVVWECLVKISIINQLTFKKVLVLLYRLCFLLDHQEIENGRFRYLPSQEILDYIAKIDFALKEGFKDKFKKDEIGLLEFLHFIDLLGWNEDVKCHIKDAKPDFEDRSKRNVGRTNTIISIISVPLMINDFLSNIIENVNYIEKINVRLILSTMQKLSKSRGICVLSHTELQKYLNPYLERLD